ncbi:MULTISPECIES: SMI1/KNR4 family protein [unclassified Nocardia]|uniref:SMI1/KNR4 family protein n=1 Tax=unclassified Nocardia TaxID=2637762 RepID=UPI001CE42B7C|nr:MULTISPECIES: SMI1/KNR4 family protein [unclassified Nocardia]
MWKELIAELYDDAEFAAPASDGDIDEIEGRLGQPVPVELRDLLRHTDGVRVEWGSGLVWPVQEIIEQNTAFRGDREFAELYGTFDQLVFFGDNGGGDQFAYAGGSPGQVAGVYVWDHETDERTWVASSLTDYLQRRAAADGEDWYR